jgi:uncharacterized membrane protein
MESRAKLFGHPIHQMLVVFPLGLLATAVVFDLVGLALSQGYWSEITYPMIAAGVVTGLLAAPFGALDWLSIPFLHPEPRQRRRWWGSPRASPWRVSRLPDPASSKWTVTVH